MEHLDKTNDRSLTWKSLPRVTQPVKNDRSLYYVGMPRVSEAHLTARRDQIIDAATARFAANGFQATGMADVIAATGLSAGAVYRYFRSKDELIAAIVDRVLGQAAGRFEQLLSEGHTPEPAEAVATGVEMIGEIADRGPVDMTRVAVQAWAEALRNPAVAAVAGHAYATMRSYFVEVARREQHAGRFGPDADPDRLGSALFSLVLGFLLQRLLLGDVEPASYVAAVRVLFA
jgi:AcrR family transcriptional regulator